MAKIIPFPEKQKPKLEFEDVVETALTVTAVNLYGNMYNTPLATPYDLDTFDLVYIIVCVYKASRSNVFSVPAREKFTSISTMIQSKM